MKDLLIFATSFLLLLALPAFTFGQTSTEASMQASLPKVFMLGENNKRYEEIMPTYQSLLEVCDGDMEVAFAKLLSMMKEMEAYADMIGYDMNGINAWMHFFWRKNGTIEHIGFHLKPSSRNIDTDELKSFLDGFIKQYRFPLTSKVPYSHYSTFSFPVIFKDPIPANSSSMNDGGN